jgi:hypothetical protein
MHGDWASDWALDPAQSAAGLDWREGVRVVRFAVVGRRQVFLLMIIPAAWSNQASSFAEASEDKSRRRRARQTVAD